MKYFKARFVKSGIPFGRAYTYKTNLNVEPGDLVEIGGTMGIVVDEPADEEWMKVYGTDNIKTVTTKIRLKGENADDHT